MEPIKRPPNVHVPRYVQMRIDAQRVVNEGTDADRKQFLKDYEADLAGAPDLMEQIQQADLRKPGTTKTPPATAPTKGGD